MNRSEGSRNTSGKFFAGSHQWSRYNRTPARRNLPDTKQDIRKMHQRMSAPGMAHAPVPAPHPFQPVLRRGGTTAIHKLTPPAADAVDDLSAMPHPFYSLKNIIHEIGTRQEFRFPVSLQQRQKNSFQPDIMILRQKPQQNPPCRGMGEEVDTGVPSGAIPSNRSRFSGS